MPTCNCFSEDFSDLYIYIYISCCAQIISKFQEILYPLMSFCLQESADLWFGVRKLNKSTVMNLKIVPRRSVEIFVIYCVNYDINSY